MRDATNDHQDMLEFLESAGIAALEHKRLQRRLESLEGRWNALQSHRDTAARKLKKMLEAEHKRELEMLGKELEMYHRAEAFIACVPGSEYRMVLRRRYLEAERSWKKIREVLAGDGVCYSQRHIARLHLEALEEARLLWTKEREEGAGRERR